MHTEKLTPAQARDRVCAIFGMTNTEYIRCSIKKAKAYLVAQGYPIELHKDQSFIEWWLRQQYSRDTILLHTVYVCADQLFALYECNGIIDASHPHTPIRELYTSAPAGCTNASLRAWLSDVLEPSELRPAAELQPVYLPPCILQD